MNEGKKSEKKKKIRNSRKRNKHFTRLNVPRVYKVSRYTDGIRVRRHDGGDSRKRTILYSRIICDIYIEVRILLHAI